MDPVFKCHYWYTSHSLAPLYRGGDEANRIGNFSKAPYLGSRQRQPNSPNCSMSFSLDHGPGREEAPRYLRKSSVCPRHPLPQGSREGESAPPEAVIREGGGELVRHPVPGIHNTGSGAECAELPAHPAPVGRRRAGLRRSRPGQRSSLHSHHRKYSLSSSPTVTCLLKGTTSIWKPD